ncbi:MAG: DNA polymerase III subunit delta' [Firmicutes bacterium]|nr:DNA polymerase III subunit delta' [Bacillota bacterium]
MPFRDVVNQDHAILLLRTAMRTGKVGHAYLLVGPAGVGRRQVALAFAQLLNCQQPADGDACGACGTCRRIAAGAHPDVRVLDVAHERFLEQPPRDYKGKEIPVDQIRALRRDAAFPPYEAAWKVYIVADAERMSAAAANSLLKTLEEPPARVVVVLVAESATALLPTIVSRCQLVRCSYLRADEIERALRDRWQVPVARARVLALLADGRLGRALEWAQSEPRLAARERLLDLLPQLEAGDLLAQLDAAEALAKDPDLLPDLLDLAVLWYRDLLVYRQLGEPARLANQDRLEAITRLAPGYDDARLGARIAALEDAKDALRRNANPRLVLERLFLSFGAPPAAAPVP